MTDPNFTTHSLTSSSDTPKANCSFLFSPVRVVLLFNHSNLPANGIFHIIVMFFVCEYCFYMNNIHIQQYIEFRI